jgi:hypothetical protein
MLRRRCQFFMLTLVTVTLLKREETIYQFDSFIKDLPNDIETPQFSLDSTFKQLASASVDQNRLVSIG